jgi:hypothetical protein
MEIYVEQLEVITSLIKVLNEWEKNNHSSELMIDQPIRLVHPQQPELLIGTLVDEIGGAWAFKPAVHQ